MNLQTIEQLASSAAGAISDLMSDEEWDNFDDLSYVEQVQYRYLHADCDDVAIALNRITGWEIRSISSERGPLHRLVSAPDGRLADITGWTSMEEIRDRYGAKRILISEPGAPTVYCSSILEEDEDFQEVANALFLIPAEPFQSQLKEEIVRFCRLTGLDVSSKSVSWRKGTP
jgi:hypothetical protein